MNKIEKSITEKYDNYINLIDAIIWQRYQIGKNDIAQDILHDIYIMLNEKTNIKCDNAFIYIYRTIHFQLITPGSIIHNKYILPMKINVRGTITEKQYIEEEIEEEKEIDVEQTIKKIKEKIIKQIPKSNPAQFNYKKTIFELYYTTYMSLRDIQNKTKIPYSSIYKTLSDIQINPEDKKILKLYKLTKKKQIQK